MLKIRLMRIGAKKKPFYRVVVLDERAKRTGAYIELLGTYNPLTEPKDIKLKQDRIDHWIKQGAQLSTGFLRIIGKAPQRLPRKPKKPARNASHSDAGGEKKVEEPKIAKETKETPSETAPEQPAEPVKEEASPKESAKSEADKSQEATEVKSDEDSRLSEAGEVSSESTSSDVHEPDQAGSEQSKEAELENQDQTNEGASSDERPA